MPIASPYREIDLPEIDLFSFFFDRQDRVFPDHQVIFRDGNDASRTQSYSKLRQASIEFGRGLQARHKFEKDDMIAIFSPNDVEYASVALGAIWAGGIVSTGNPGSTVPEIAFQLKDCGAKVVVTQQRYLPTIQKACHSLGISDSNIVLMGLSHVPLRQFQHWTSVCDTEGIQRMHIPRMNPKSDVAFLVYSSGTTGRPKGVQITHYNMTSNICQGMIGLFANMSWKDSIHVPGIPDAPAKTDTTLSCLPFYHIYGLMSMVLAPVYSGITNIVMSRFEIEKWCSLVQEHQVTSAFIVPPIAILLSKHPIASKYDLSSLRMAYSAAAPMRKELVEAVFSRLGVRIQQTYGTSETSPTAWSLRWKDWLDRAGSCGCLMPNMEAKFCAVPESEGYIGEHLKEMKNGEVGEMYLRGPNVFKGYHNNTAATRDCLSKDGWYRTGDVGYADEDGNLYITDRVKELIKYKGFQVPPAELEGYLIDHELVDDVAVVGVELEELGTEVPRAYVVRKNGMAAVCKGDDEKIVDWLAEKVTNHKKLRGGVRFVQQIPKSEAGKILRRTLKEEVKKEQQAAKEVQLKAKL